MIGDDEIDPLLRANFGGFRRGGAVIYGDDEIDVLKLAYDLAV